MNGMVTAADVQDREGGLAMLGTLFSLFPFLTKLFADSAYEGPIFHTALATQSVRHRHGNLYLLAWALRRLPEHFMCQGH